MTQLCQNVITWTLPGGDIGQTSMWTKFTGTPTAAQALARFQTNVVDTVWPSGAGGVKALHPTGCVLSNVQTRTINLGSGAVISTAAAAYTRAGTAGGNSLPAEVSVVMSLRTALAGASYRGRMYLPMPSTSSSSSAGRLVSGDQTTMVTQWSNAIIAMNADVSFGTCDVVIRSRKNASEEVVTSIDIGDVFDAQRRRRNALTESRTSAAV